MDRRMYLYSVGTLLSASSFAGCLNSTVDNTAYADKEFTVIDRSCGEKQSVGELNFMPDTNTVELNGVISGRSRHDNVRLSVFSSSEEDSFILNMVVKHDGNTKCDEWGNIQYKGKVDFGDTAPSTIYLGYSTPMGDESITYLKP